MYVNITHPMADEMSIIDHPLAMAGSGSKEIAFFMNNEWVTDIISEFAEYADAQAMDTRVYGYVPIAAIDEFLDNYSL